jgi:hypothetical protein
MLKKFTTRLVLHTQHYLDVIQCYCNYMEQYFYLYNMEHYQFPPLCEGNCNKATQETGFAGIYRLLVFHSLHEHVDTHAPAKPKTAKSIQSMTYVPFVVCVCLTWLTLAFSTTCLTCSSSCGWHHFYDKCCRFPVAMFEILSLVLPLRLPLQLLPMLLCYFRVSWHIRYRDNIRVPQTTDTAWPAD